MSSQLPYKLQQYEAAPPHSVWSAIEAELNQQAKPSLSEKLANFEAQPPATIWNKIDHSLNNTDSSKGKVIMLSRSWLRYAVAAMLVAVAIFIFNFRQDNTDTRLANQSAVSVPPPSTSGHTTDKANPDANIPDSKHDQDMPADERTAGVDPMQETTSASSMPPKRYMTVAMDNGEKVRLSKKVLPVFECADKATAAISKKCKESIENLQVKMASTLASPSTDFAGLIDMIKTLEENK